MEQTSNLALNLPSGSDAYNVEDYNENFEVLDKSTLNLTGTTEPTADLGGEGSMYFLTETDGENIKIKKTYVKTNGTWVELKMGGSGVSGSGVISCSLRTSVTVEKED